MCRSIKRLNNKDIEATQSEIEAAARQFVRKVSGFREPSKKNKEAFDKSIKTISKATKKLLNNVK